MIFAEKIGIFCTIFGLSLTVFFVRGIAISRDLERLPTLKEIFLGAALSVEVAKSLRRGCLVIWGVALFLLVLLLLSGTKAATATNDVQTSAARGFFGIASVFLFVFSFHLKQIFFNGLCRPSYLLELKKRESNQITMMRMHCFLKNLVFFLILMGEKKR